MKTKECTNCGFKRSIKNFYKEKRNRDELNSWCKDCIGVRASIYYQDYKKEINRKHKEYYYKLYGLCCLWAFLGFYFCAIIKIKGWGIKFKLKQKPREKLSGSGSR